MVFNFFLLFIFITNLAGCLSAQPQTCAAEPAAGDNRAFSLQFVKETGISRIETSYSAKWDFQDLPLSYPGMLKLIASPFTSLKNAGREMLWNSSMKIYGLKINPWKIRVYEQKGDLSPAEKKTGGAQDRASGKKLKISLLPVIEEMYFDAEEQMRNKLLKKSFGFAGDYSRNLDLKSKRIFTDDILSVYDRWRLPGADKARSGMNYLLNGK